MDALSDVLRGFSLDGGVFLDAQLTAPWAFKREVGCAPTVWRQRA